MIHLTEQQIGVIKALAVLSNKTQKGFTLEAIRDERMKDKIRDPRYNYLRSTQTTLKQLYALVPNLVEKTETDWRLTYTALVVLNTQLKGLL